MELPNVNDMSVQDKTNLIRDLLANLINNTNSDTNQMLQLLSEAARMDAMNPVVPPPADDDALPADADAPVADHDMGNAAEDAPPNNGANGCAHEVSIDSGDDNSSDDNSDGAEENGDAF